MAFFMKNSYNTNKITKLHRKSSFLKSKMNTKTIGTRKFEKWSLLV